MKRHLLAIAFLFALTSGAGAQSAAKPLIWGADPDGGVPYVFADPANPEKYIGVEVDIADALSRELGRGIEFKSCDYATLLSHVERGDIDIAMNGLEITPAHRNRVRFSKAYYLYQLQLAVRTESRFQSLDELKSAGKTVGSLESSMAERLLNDGKFISESYKDQEGLYRDLSQGRRIDGVLLDLPGAIYYAAPDEHLKYSRRIPGLRLAGAPFAEGYYGIAIHKNNEALEAQLNAAIDRIRDSGELKRILQKWELWNADQYRLTTAKAVEADSSKMSFATYFPLLLDGAIVTVRITLKGMALAVLLGLPIALGRLYGSAPVRWLAITYVEFFRGIPVLLLLYFLYFGLAAMWPPLAMGPETAAVLGFGLNYAAYEAEIYRAGIASIPAGQWEAAASLGMAPSLSFRRIILPQAIRVILPPMTNDLVALFKDTSVVSIIAVTELSKQYQVLTKTYGGYLEIGLVTAALYLAMSVPLGYLSRYLEHRWGSR